MSEPPKSVRWHIAEEERPPSPCGGFTPLLRPSPGILEYGLRMVTELGGLGQFKEVSMMPRERCLIIISHDINKLF
jgi:hypothetical protein